MPCKVWMLSTRLTTIVTYGMYTTPVLITITDSLTVYTVEGRVERMGEM